MYKKSEKVIKRIIKAVGKTQPVLIIGEWQEEIINGLKENENSITQVSDLSNSSKEVKENSFTRIIADYNSPLFKDEHFFFEEARKLLLPTGTIIVSANNEDGIFDKLFGIFQKKKEFPENIKLIKPKTLQNQIHDHGFSIEGYYGYPGNHILMMAEINNKEVSTLFNSKSQETLKV